MDKTCLQIRMQINGALPFTPCDVGDLEFWRVAQIIRTTMNKILDG